MTNKDMIKRRKEFHERMAIYRKISQEHCRNCPDYKDDKGKCFCNTSCYDLDDIYYDVLEGVKSKINIPIAMKIGRNFTSLPNLLSQLDKRGLDGVVMFNRFTEPDIDIYNLKMRTTFSFSSQEEIHALIRWIALVSPNISADISATTGIHTAEGIIKLLLAGASTVQLASVLYKNGVGVISKMLGEISEWMSKYDLENIDDFKGRVGFSPEYDPEVYLRAQFMEKIRGIE